MKKTQYGGDVVMFLLTKKNKFNVDENKNTI